MLHLSLASVTCSIISSVPSIASNIYLQPIENIIRLQLIPALCDGRNCSDDERKLLSLPIKLGGMGIINVLDTAQCDYETSIQLTSKLQDQIVNQSEEFISDDNKKTSRAIKGKKLALDVEALEKLREKMTSSEKKANDIARSEGASIWLTTLPLKEENYVLNKQEFSDGLYMRYMWELKNLPSNCACDAKFTLEHALSCHLGGYIIQRHNNLRDLAAILMKEVSYDVRVEPALLEVRANEIEDLSKSAIKGNEARADVRANGFWLRYQRAFFDIKVCNLLAPSYRTKSMVNTLSAMEKERKRKYNTRIQQIDRGTFTPLVFGATGGVAREASIFLNRLAEKLAEKRKDSKGDTISAIRRKISFTLLTLFIPAPRFRSAQQKLLPAIMERLTAVICPSRSFNVFLSRCFSKKTFFKLGTNLPVSAKMCHGTAL